MRDLHLIELTVNGERYELAIESRRTLADVIRHDVGLRGTHLGCEHGICGACTVLVEGVPTRSCLTFGVQADGRSIETVEGLGAPEHLSRLQDAFSAYHALQCGFCTPGFLMLATAYLRECPRATEEEIRDVVASNLCRCTGYQSIVEAIASLTNSGGAG